MPTWSGETEMGANIKDVAKVAGVSPSTVSRVISRSPRISKATTERVLEVMKQLDYHPNTLARSLVTKSSRTIGILIPRTTEEFLKNPFFPELLRGVAQATQNHGFDIYLSTALNGSTDSERLLGMARSQRVDGILLPTSRADDDLLRVVEEHSIPSVLIGRPADQSSVLWVDNNNHKAAYEVTDHLLKLGHEKIGFIGGARDLIVTQDRLAGYRDALSQHGYTLDSSLVYSGAFLEEVGYDGMVRLLARVDRPTAVVASDDVLAFGAMRAAGELGYRIPEDIAITGFNDIPLAKLANPPMTSMNMNIFELGRVAATLLVELIVDPDSEHHGTIVDHTLVVRGSSGSPKLHQN